MRRSLFTTQDEMIVKVSPPQSVLLFFQTNKIALNASGHSRAKERSSNQGYARFGGSGASTHACALFSKNQVHSFSYHPESGQPLFRQKASACPPLCFLRVLSFVFTFGNHCVFVSNAQDSLKSPQNRPHHSLLPAVPEHQAGGHQSGG